MSSENQFKELSNQLEEGGWPGLSQLDNKLTIGIEKSINILKKEGDRYHLNFAYYNSIEEECGLRNINLSSIVFDKDISLYDIVYFYGRNNQYKPHFYREIQDILELSKPFKESAAERIKILDISSSYDEISYDGRSKIMKIPLDLYLIIKKDAGKAKKVASKYKKSVRRRLINKFAENHFDITVQSQASISPGEFNFLTENLNLGVRQKQEDFDKYLNDDDIDSLQKLSISLIENEIFDEDFLRRLDNYFIKEKLEEIITLGRKVLDLGSKDITTNKAQKVISQLNSEKEIGQLEAVWQEYLRKYLLYLIFSYKKIYPKIKLKLDKKEKQPDFIGINHYNGVDIIEIKTHLKRAMTWDSSHNNFSFSAEMSKALIQTMNYMDSVKKKRFQSHKERKKITDFTEEENLYSPRGIIIISSYDRLAGIKKTKEKKQEILRDFTKLRNSFNNIEVLTFDDILNIADNYTENIVNSQDDS